MTFNPRAVFTTLAVVAAGLAGFFVLKPSEPAKPVVAVSAPAPAVEVKQPEQQVAIVAAPVVKPEPAPAPIIAPSFDTVRVESSGEAVIAGRAQPNTEVVAKLNGEVVASTTSNADGAFVMIPAKPLPAGAGTLSLETKAEGAMQVSSATVAVAVKPQGQGEATVAVLAPDQPTKIVQAPAAPANSVVLDAVDYNAAGDIVFSGRALPNSAVRLYVDNAITGEVKADDIGKWTYLGQTAVRPGTHTLRADAIAADGSVSSRVELPFLREEPAKVAAAAPATTTVEVAKSAEPAPTQVAAAPAVVSEPQPTRIVIQPGNSLWKISRELYGAGRNYTVIYEANKDQIRNPRLIYPGQILTAPIAKTP